MAQPGVKASTASTAAPKDPTPQYGELLRTYLAPQWRRATLLLALLLAGVGLQLVNPLVVRFYIDTARTGGSLETLTQAAAAFVGVVLLTQLLAVLTTSVGQTLAWSSTNRLRHDLALHCLRLDLPFHHARTPGQMIERIDGDVGTLANFLSQFVLRVLTNVLLLAGALVVLGLHDWRLGLAFAVFVGLALGLFYRVRGIAVPHWRATRDAATDLYALIEERLGGLEDTRANGIGDYVMRRLHAALARHYHAMRRFMFFTWISSFISFTVLGVGEVLTFGLGGYLFTTGAISLGTLYMAAYFLGTLLWPLRSLVDQIQDVQRAGVSLRRIQELRQVRPSIVDGTLDPPAHAPRVELRGVTFAYPTSGDATSEYASGPSVLQDLSFTIEPGSTLAVVGWTGSGKSTLARLLARFYDPTDGAILFDGTDLRRFRLAELRARVGLVTQDVQLFQATLRDNLTLFDPGVLDERLTSLLADMGLGSWLASLPGGLETELSAGGTGLSAGEAQLVALARVFFKDPVLVILDEASSRLDPATERLVEVALGRLLGGRTGIVIAHRLETVRRAHEVLMLEGGRVVEHGPRERLVADPCSRFSQLLRIGAATGATTVDAAVEAALGARAGVPA